MNKDDLQLVEKLDKATADILGRHAPLLALLRFYQSVMYPEVPKLEPITRKVRQVSTGSWK